MFRKVQEVQLDKHVVLLDSPGVVLAQKSMDEASAALRNAIKVGHRWGRGGVSDFLAAF